ncbi:hypothetical protein Pelo_19222 [Pelomyxa schiedti]|nr:hypothetical protein Pelo_19222 [Pelomyxa schiedti]
MTLKPMFSKLSTPIATWQTWRCFDDEPVWSTDVGFTSAPMEVTLFTSTDCSGESVMKMAATVECVTAGDYAYWGYCYPREGNIMGYGCYTASGYFGDCVDKDSKPWSYTGSICSGVAFVDAYDETAGDTCFDLGSTSMDDFLVTGETYTFTMTCGDMTTNSVWWTESYLDSESGCTEVSPIEAEGYYTRFCGATEEGTCVEQTQDTILKTWEEFTRLPSPIASVPQSTQPELESS